MMGTVNSLESIIEKYDIDEVALQSIVESCLESEDVVYKKAQTSYLFPDGGSYSNKPSNIKSTFNIGYAMQILEAVNSISSGEKGKLLLGILEVIMILKNASDISLSELESSLLYLIAENIARSPREIYEYILHTKEEIDADNIDKALKNLEKLGIIELDNGVYVNVEKVVIES